MSSLNANETQAFDERPSRDYVSGSLSPERDESVDRDTLMTGAARRTAYAHGRRHQRGRRGSSLAAGLVVMASAGVFAIALSIHEGSFARAGQVVDQHIASATGAVSRATRQLVAEVGDALSNAGDELKRSASG